MEYITRKKLLYKTGVEYGDYTMNHVLGCSHGCRYPCYAFLLKKRFGQVKTYEEWCEPKIVANTLELLDKEIPRLKDKIKSVQLCFTTDPFMYGVEEIGALSLSAVRKLNDAGILSQAHGTWSGTLRRTNRGIEGVARGGLQDMGQHGALPDAESD